VAWSVITFFVVPVILFEPLGVIESVKRSSSIFKQRWGETFVGQGAIGLAMILLALPVIGVSVLIGMASTTLAAVIGGLALAVLTAVGSALSGIFNAALYRYATEGEAAGAFESTDLQGAFRPKR
jgi:hypothetical protein